MTDRIRTTISLTPEAHDIFKRMGEACNMSVSRCMGDWLSDTADAALMITLQMEEAKSAPMKVLREMQGLLAGLGEAVIETSSEVAQLQASERTARAAARTERIAGSVAAAPLPPSSNTGGKSPTAKAKTISSRVRK